jgi:hypothetical protein
LQGMCVNEMPQPWLPNAYAGNLVTD